MTIDRRKYLFDLNNFDDSASRDKPEEDLPPPPPVFSLGDLERAEQSGFERGREAALEESKLSREQYIAGQISFFHDQIRSLLLAEQMRERKFEEEVLRLCRTMFSHCFPTLSAKHSIDETIRMIEDVLKNQDQSKIMIEVPLSDYDEIAAQMAGLLEIEGPRIHLEGADDLNPGDCRMKWENGGAFRHQSEIVEKIMQQLEELLAPNVQKSHNTPHDIALASDGEK